ncbi:MAG: RHS repeat-associated core domain-containing protein [bacterium]
MNVGSYSYNGMGKRVSKVAGTVNSTYLWDGEKLAGSFFDCESGLYQMRGRYYDPLMGRFLTQDILPGNPYSYCKNNPVSMVDPSGWMYMYRASVLGGEAGTYAQITTPFYPSDLIYFQSGWPNCSTWAQYYLAAQIAACSSLGKKIVTIAEFFLGQEAKTLFPEADPYNCCARFVSLVLRLANEFNEGENYSYVGMEGEGGLLDALLNVSKGKNKGVIGSIVVFDTEEKFDPNLNKIRVYHHVGFYIGGRQYIGSNNLSGGPQSVRLDPLFACLRIEYWYWW